MLKTEKERTRSERRGVARDKIREVWLEFDKKRGGFAMLGTEQDLSRNALIRGGIERRGAVESVLCNDRRRKRN